MSNSIIPNIVSAEQTEDFEKSANHQEDHDIGLMAWEHTDKKDKKNIIFIETSFFFDE